MRLKILWSAAVLNSAENVRRAYGLNVKCYLFNSVKVFTEAMLARNGCPVGRFKKLPGGLMPGRV